MKSFALKLLLVSVAALVLRAEAHGQAAGGTLGAFGFVNGVDSDSPTFLAFNGTPYKVKGYKSGQMTMSGLLPEGPAVFSVSNEKLGSAELSQEVSRAKPFNIFAYVGKKKAESGELVDELRLIQSPSRPSKNYTWSGLYLTAQTNAARVFVNNQAVTLAPMKISPLAVKGSIDVGLESGKPPVMSAAPDVPAHYMLIAYDKKDGGLGFVLFPDSPEFE